MTKKEIIEAINATIVPNNVKGITAESLANILIEMVNAEGGSGDGALRVIVPDTMVGSMIVDYGELSPTSWIEFKEASGVLGMDFSEYDEVVEASFVHNADVAQQILAKAREGKGVSVVLDFTPYGPVAVKIAIQQAPELGSMFEELVLGGVQPASVNMQYVKPLPGTEEIAGFEDYVCMLVPTGYLNDAEYGLVNYSSDMVITLRLDGSLTFTKPSSENDTESDS